MYARTSLLAVIAGLAIAVAVPTAQAQTQAHDPYVCTVDASTHPPGATFDNVVVPPGGFCQLAFVTVRGNVKALEDAILGIAFSNVGGNVEGDKADEVQVRDSTVGGDITIREGGPHPLFFEVDLLNVTLPNGNVHIQKMTGSISVGLFAGNHIPNGSVQVEDNVIPAGEIFHVGSNTIGGNLQVFKNVGLGSKQVQFNTVTDGVIQCWENDQPFVGGPNSGRADPFMGPPFFGPNQCIGSPAT